MPVTAPKFTFEEPFQERIVRLAFQDEGFATVAIDHLPSTLFDNPVHRWVMSKVQWHLRTYGTTITASALQQERKKAVMMGLIKKEQGLAYKRFLLNRLSKPVPDRSYIVDEVQRFVKHQRLKSLSLRIAEEWLPAHDYEAIDKELDSVREIDFRGDHSIGTFPGKTWKKRIEERKNEKLVGYTTGIPALDRLMRAEGVPPKQLGFVLAPTGRGKTNWLLNLAVANALEGVQVAYYSLELSEEELAPRIDARCSNVPIKALKNNVEEVIEGWSQVSKHIANNLVVKEFPMDELTVAGIKTHMRRLERFAFYPKVIVVDYLDLLRPRVEYTDSSYETQGGLAKELRGFAQREGIVAWTGGQGNRKTLEDEHGDLDLSGGADSIKKFFVADVVVGLAQSPKEAKEDKMRAVVLKNRNGPKDREIPMLVKHETCTFREIQGGRNMTPGAATKAKYGSGKKGGSKKGKP